MLENSRLQTLCLILLFAMLWLPLGQYPFMLEHWMKLGTYAVPFLLIGASGFYHKEEAPNGKSLKFIALLFFIAYVIHQFEEHWVDLTGTYYAFFTYNNNLLHNILGVGPEAPIVLTQASVYVINTSLVWLVALNGFLRAPRHIFPLLAMAGITMVNALVHIIASLRTFAYNPGLLSSCLIFLPLYFWSFRYITKRNSNSRKQLFAGLLWAFLAHVIMIGGMLAANWFHWIPEWLYFILLIIWSLLPLMIYQNKMDTVPT